MVAVLRLARSQSDWIRPAYLTYLLIGAWVISMIALPIARWIIGDAALIWGVNVTTLLQFAAVAAVVLAVWGLKRTGLILGIVAIVTFLAEFVGSKTGLPFGHYYYTELLQPQLAGVPLLIPLAWFMMLPPAWAVAQVLVGMQNRWHFAVVSAVALTAWDLFLDPQNVAWGLWVWTEGTSQTVFTGGYFGIPWLNYVGWLLVAFLVTLLAYPPQVPVKPLLLVYGIVWLFQTIGQLFFWDLPGPGLVGFIGMGTMLLLVWWRRREVLA